MRVRWLAGRSFTAVTGLLLAAGAFAAPGQPAASAARCQAWTGAQPASPGTLDNALNSVAVLSPCDVWAAGFDVSSDGGFQTLIEHWNGFSWAQVDSPDPGSGNKLPQQRPRLLPVQRLGSRLLQRRNQQQDPDRALERHHLEDGAEP